ncbi:MAG TPA: hypothetical protein VNW97_19780 [Candidatus Saccharimonadales bacterium]|jgi:hypothetical protein|nr:hypothetical protein [Candidatus Saccharimonadales bacterium]
MSFLDNLESNLKDLESGQERDPNERKRRDSERALALAAAPWAEKLKNSPYTQELLKAATHAGFQVRKRVNMAWLGTSLKLELQGRTLALSPTPEGIVAVLSRDGKEEQRLPVGLEGNAGELIQMWLG